MGRPIRDKSLATGHYTLHGHSIRVEYGIVKTVFNLKKAEKIGIVTGDRTRDVRFVKQQFYHPINEAHTGFQHWLFKTVV